MGAVVIECRLRELMASHGRREHRRITYDDIFLGTKISKSTLTRLSNDRADGVTMSVLDRLCNYFDCQPGDLFVSTREPDDT